MTEQAISVPVDVTDDVIRRSLAEADLPTLLVTLVHLTGDISVLRGDARPQWMMLSSDDGLTESQREVVRERAAGALADLRDGKAEPYMPSDDELREMLSFLVGDRANDDYLEFLQSELSLNGEDPYAQPLMDELPVGDKGDFKVLIIGAGMSGLLSSIRLKAAGIEFEVVEKNPDVGGTWLENTYPGCRVDSANHTYSYSFRPQDWPQHYSDQGILKQYFSDTADDYDLRDHITFNTEVLSARFDEAASLWHVEVKSEDGKTSTRTANAVISCVGQLNRPNMPNIKGMERYQGISFHSSRWQHEHDFAGKKIGVIGTGGSAFQFAPLLAEEAELVTLFQRTPPWIVPNENYFQEIPAGKHWLLNHVPFYGKWYRFNMFWRSAEGLLPAVTGDAGWNRPEESVGELNQMLRDFLVGNLEEHLSDRPDLLEKCTPNYPPGAKRALIDDGKYLQSLKRDNVRLVTEGIETITETGIQTVDGEDHEFDVLIYATGFTASDFLMPMKIYGVGGKELHDEWGGEARAYKGITMPGFPNLFCTYGPNTNIVINGSIIFFSECEVRYILGCLALSMGQGKKALDVKQDIHDSYNAWIDEGNTGMAWGQSGVNTWYKNAEGHITQNWPFTLLEFWQQTRTPDLSDYNLV